MSFNVAGSCRRRRRMAAYRQQNMRQHTTYTAHAAPILFTAHSAPCHSWTRFPTLILILVLVLVRNLARGNTHTHRPQPSRTCVCRCQPLPPLLSHSTSPDVNSRRSAGHFGGGGCCIINVLDYRFNALGLCIRLCQEELCARQGAGHADFCSRRVHRWQNENLEQGGGSREGSRAIIPTWVWRGYRHVAPVGSHVRRQRSGVTRLANMNMAADAYRTRRTAEQIDSSPYVASYMAWESGGPVSGIICPNPRHAILSCSSLCVRSA